MNHYPRHVGDITRDTFGLSLTEFGAYDRLLDAYYATEKPLPLAASERYRMAGATSKADRAAVDYVVSRYFTEAPDGWHQKRCDTELAKYAEKSEKARASAYASVDSRSKTREQANKELRSQRMVAARAKGTHTKEEWAALVEFCGGKCVKCGADGHQDRDHIVPVYQGGSDGIDNIQPLCARCNAGKGPDASDHRPPGWREAIAQRTLSERSANQNQEPVTKNHKAKREIRAPISAPTDEHRSIATELRLDCEVEWLKYRDQQANAPRKHSDLQAGFRNWLRRAKEFQPQARAGPAKQEARARVADDIWKGVDDGRSNERVIDGTAERVA